MKSFQDYLTETQEIGFVEEAVQSLGYVSGLPAARPSEIVLFETGERGQILSLHKDLVEVLVFSNYPIKVGTKVARTNEILQIPVGTSYIGKTIDPLGNPLDKLHLFEHPKESRVVDTQPTGIGTRKRISRSFATGVTMVDMLIPLGCGQRELVMGDRKTGKTNFLYQTILKQSRSGTLCIYAAVGKKKTDIKAAEDFFIKNNIMNNMMIIASNSQDPSGIIFLTPFTAMTYAEYFRDLGRDVLLVLDDLFTHAKFYREISLLAHRFPGRNSYPADIFYTHARLMERAGNFIRGDGEVAITCLPVIETVQGDLAGYIQTNLMSITDGHLFFDSDLFARARRPAVNPFVSVSRVGRQTQTDLKRSINREIMSILTLHTRMENFVHFGAEANPSINATLAIGDRILSFFNQDMHIVIDEDMQIFLFGLLWLGIWNEKNNLQMKAEMAQILETVLENQTLRKQIQEIIQQPNTLNDLLTILRQNFNRLMPAIGVLKQATIQQPPTIQTQSPTQSAAVPISNATKET